MDSRVAITKSNTETQKLGESFAEKIKNGGIVALYGDLGAGKTTFVQGFAKGLGINQRIISPTFIIVRQYKVSSEKLAVSCLYHIDLYRVQSQKEIEGLGIKEILNDPHNIVVIEWAEKLKNVLPKKLIEVRFEYVDENTRKIKIYD